MFYVYFSYLEEHVERVEPAQPKEAEHKSTPPKYLTPRITQAPPKQNLPNFVEKFKQGIN